MRLGLALGAALFGGHGISQSLANAIVKVDPWRAHLLAPNNGRIAAAAAERQFTFQLEAAANSKTALLAQQALRRDPTAVKAAAVLALQADLRGDGGRSDRIFAFANRLSRRELRPQIWAIEKAVTRGDVDGALKHYDVALKTSFSAQSVLYPVLAGALAEPRIRSAVIGMLEHNPPWSTTFGIFITMRGINPEAAALLLLEGQHIPLPVSDAQQAVLLDTLLAQDKADLAWRYYSSYRPKARRNASRDPRFALSAEAAGPFDWRITETPGASISILGGTKGGVVQFSLSQGASGPMLAQVQMLAPGVYSFDAQGELTGNSAPDSFVWSLECKTGRMLGRVAVRAASSGAAISKRQFMVPAAGCPVQVLSLNAAPGRITSDLTGHFNSVLLVPAREKR